MPKPVINTTQSVLGYLQFQTWEFQPVAIGGVTSWSCSTLPTGLAFNTATGKISGAVLKPGVYVFALRATNGSGTSDPVVFTIGIEASAGSNGTDVDLIFDLLSRRVSLVTGIPPQGAVDVGPLVPVFRARMSDQLILNVRLVKGGVTIDVTPTVFKLAAKSDDAETALVLSSGTHRRVNAGDNMRLRLPVCFTAPALKTAIEEEELPATEGPFKGKVVRTPLLALAELELVYANPDATGGSSVGPANIRIASDTFVIEVSRNIVP